MNANECALAVEAWINAVIPELADSYHFLPASKKKLPDVAVDTAEQAIVVEDQRFAYMRIEQTWLRVFEVEAIFMVDSPDKGPTPDPDADRSEQEQLRDFATRLEASLLVDGTLGGRVQRAATEISFNFRLPFVQYADGTRGRQMQTNLAVAEHVQHPGE